MKATKVRFISKCQEQCIDPIPYYLSGLSPAHLFPTTFLKIAVNGYIQTGVINKLMIHWAIMM